MLDFIEKKAKQTAVMTALLLSILYLLQLVIFFGIGGRDDSYITYWSAFSISHMGEIVNYNGDRIEQSSSLLQVLLLAATHIITGISIPVLGVVFSIACGIATALLTGRLARDIGITCYKWIPFVIIFVPYFSYWSSSGMETSLTALCVVLLLITTNTFLTVPFSKTNFLAVSLCILLFILVRPESAIILLVFFIALLLLQSFNSKIIFLIAATLIIFAGLAAWRHLYFGQIFPQPVYAKTDITHGWDRLQLGLRYLKYSLNFSTILLAVLTLFGVTRFFLQNKKIASNSITYSLLFLLVYLAFIACAGGDWMEGRRLLVPVLPVLCALTFMAVTHKKWVHLTLAVFFSLALIDSWQFSQQESIGLPLNRADDYMELAKQINPGITETSTKYFTPMDRFNYSHLRDMLTIPVLDELVASLSTNKSEPVYIASRQMGMIPYYIASKHYKKVRFIDLRGLVTRDIPDCNFISGSKPKSSSGILVTTHHYLEYQEQIHSSCSLPIVDIVYDTGLIGNSVETTSATLNKNDYMLYYAQGSETKNLFAQYIGINARYKNFIP